MGEGRFEKKKSTTGSSSEFLFPQFDDSTGARVPLVTILELRSVSLLFVCLRCFPNWIVLEIFNNLPSGALINWISIARMSRSEAQSLIPLPTELTYHCYRQYVCSSALLGCLNQEGVLLLECTDAHYFRASRHLSLLSSELLTWNGTKKTEALIFNCLFVDRTGEMRKSFDSRGLFMFLPVKITTNYTSVAITE